jgi:hypothetical protein
MRKISIGCLLAAAVVASGCSEVERVVAPEATAASRLEIGASFEGVEAIDDEADAAAENTEESRGPNLLGSGN